MKKTTLTILFASVMMLALIGCGTKKAEAASDPWEETTVAEETPGEEGAAECMKSYWLLSSSGFAMPFAGGD